MDKIRTLEEIAKIMGLSTTDLYRIRFIRKYSRELFNYLLNSDGTNPENRVYPNYKKVRRHLDSFHYRYVELKLTKSDEITEQDIIELAQNYEFLTYPFK